ncbi:hypothetical protein N431DRAFT_64443 [Stipitochalara longipes BDJ]|nr:hypothetical protein N431DRAFT_64443 [Stipitochalara longipes BDJ]
MAQPPPTPSGSEVSKVESDVSQTISLADSIVTLVREPVVLLYENYNKAQELKRNLGPWHGEAIDSHGQCRIPVLRLKEFEDYLVKTDGRLSPQVRVGDMLSPGTQGPGRKEKNRNSWRLPWSSPKPSPQPENTPAAKACWAYFLLALGIQPGMGIVGWRPSSDGFINTQNGGIEMEVDGAVLCHIMNLYALSLDPNPWVRVQPKQIPRYTDQKLCTFPFGRLGWEKTNGQIHAHFEPGLEKELGAEKIPFARLTHRPEANTLVVTYFTALMHGISDPDLQLADPKAPLKERIRRLLDCLYKLRCGSDKPRIFSYRWIEEAARIKRRVLAQGGKDHSFFKDICETIEKQFSDANELRAAMISELRERFLLDEEIFTIWVPANQGNPSEISTSLGLSLRDMLEETLKSYEHQLSGTWKHDLYEMRRDVIKILYTSNKIFLNRNTSLLEFTSGSPMWHERILLGAPLP